MQARHISVQTVQARMRSTIEVHISTNENVQCKRGTISIRMRMRSARGHVNNTNEDCSRSEAHHVFSGGGGTT